MSASPPARRLVFVHTLPDDDLSGGTIVALTGQAYVACVDRGLSPTTIDDHVDRRGLLLEGRLDDLRWQIGWFKQLAEIGSASPRALQLCRHVLHGPLDAVIANARLLDGVVSRHAPSEIVYTGPQGTQSDPWHGNHLYFSTELGDEPLSEVLVRAIALDRGIPFTHVTVPRAVVAPDTGRFKRGWARVRRRIGAARNLRPGRRSHAVSSSLLLWAVGYGARDYAATERARGHRVLGLRRGEATTCVLEPGWVGLRRRGPSISTEVPPQARHNGLDLDLLIAAVDDRARVPGAGAAIRTRIEAYCQRVCPTVDRVAKGLTPVLARMQVERVAATNPFTVEEFGALLACSSLDQPPYRTLVQHGDAAFPYDCWLVRDLPSFDELACTDPTVPASLVRAAAALGERLPAFGEDAPRLDDFHRRVRSPKRRRSASGHSGPRTVCYVPTGFQGENNQLCGAGFDDAWYARWQLQLLDAMIGRPDIQFVWKAAPAGLQIDPDPLRTRLVGSGEGNVSYTATPFREVVGTVDRVFLDFASTALFEAVRVGVPTLCVSFSTNEDLRPEAVEVVGRCLRPVRDEDDARQLFEQFLDDDRTLWLPPSGAAPDRPITA